MMGRRFRKTYLAIVTPGAPDPAGGTIEHHLRREEIGRESYMRIAEADEPGAETALTRYRTLSKGEGAALVECSPQTGRMHQLRVHLASIGRPIAGDVRYGGALTVNGVTVPRLMLHAARLSFPHPGGGTTTIEAPMPDDMRVVAESLGLATPSTDHSREGGNPRGA
jgi:tRNA pseudouridine32 synthase/23S rRNA pseudouridine746 synthase